MISGLNLSVSFMTLIKPVFYESRRMRHAYKYAVSSISAAAVWISTGGCSFECEHDAVRAFEAHAPLCWKKRQLLIFGTDDTNWQSMLDDTPLSRRTSTS